LVCPRNDYVVAKVARSIASDADCRNSENPCHRKIKQVVGIGIRVWWQAVCHSKEISVVAYRVSVSLVMDSVIIPIVGVDSAADSLDLVGVCQEITIGRKDNLRIDGAVRVAAEEEVFPCEDAGTIVAVKPPQSALAWNGRHWNANGADFVRGVARCWTNATVDEIPE
jgi:hypothetical protein